MSAARTEKSRLSDTSFNAGVNPVLDKKAYLEEKSGAVQHQFQNQLGAKKGQHQQGKTGQGEADRGLAAPAQLIVTPQQHGKQQPGDDGQHGFVYQALAENIVDKHEARGN